MLRIFYGEDRLELSKAIIDTICVRAKEGIGGQILIVPEQFSHETERALCAAGGDSICRYAEVLSFSRLASRACSIYGGISDACMDNGGKLLMVCRAVDQVRPQLKYFASASMKAEFLQSLGSVFDEFIADGLTSKQLAQAAEHMQGMFAQKLTELSVLFESYLSVCEADGIDPSTHLQRLCDILAEEAFAQGKTIYFDGFSDFTAVQLEIFKHLLCHADEVQIALCIDGSIRSAYAAANRTKNALKNMAARHNIASKQEKIGLFSARSAAISNAVLHLFKNDGTIYPDACDELEVHRATNTADECAFAASRVCELVKSGLRWRDIAVMVTDKNAYYANLRAVFSRAGIEAYFSGSTDIVCMPLIGAVIASLQAAERYDYESVMQYLKSDISPIDMEQCDKLERYAYTWNMRGTAWETEWNLHPDGYGNKWDDDAKETVTELNEIKAIAIAPLKALREGLRGAQTVGQMLMALNAFFEQVMLRQRLQARTEALYDEGKLQTAQQYEQLYSIILQAMEQMYTVLAECAMTQEQFRQIFTMLLSRYRVGTIPASVDQVYVGATEDLRHKKVKALIVLGANEGALPAVSADHSILNDDERKKLLDLQLPLAPAQAERLEQALGIVRASFSSACERLLISTSGDEPASLVRRLEKIFPSVKKTSMRASDFYADTMSAASALCRNEEESAPRAVAEAASELKQKSEYRFMPLARETVKALYGDEIYFSASRIDKLAGCQYAYFLNYGLKAKPWNQAKFDAPVFGLFVHWVLEQMTAHLRDADYRNVSDEQVIELAKKYAQQYTETNMPDLLERGERFAYLYQRNIDELISICLDVVAELRISRFRPVDEELEFSGKAGAGLPPVRIKGKLASSMLNGYVDRVDLYEKDGAYYCRVIDYKTGVKEFDYADLLNGQGLQMLIYLFTLRRYGHERYGKPIIPAGVLYIPAKDAMISLKHADDIPAVEGARMKNRRRKGLVLSDETILSAMEDVEQPCYLPCKRTKNGMTGDMADGKQMQMLERFVMQSVANLTDQLASGAVEPNPINRELKYSMCEFCEYASACHQDLGYHDDRASRRVNADEFWVRAERMVEHE